MEEQPFFIVGAMQSGQPLLLAMLRRHPALHVAPGLNEAIFRLPERGWPAPDELREHLRRDRAFGQGGYRLDGAPTARAMIREIVAQAQERAGAARTGFVLHMRFARLLDLWPDAPVVHLVRDPRAVALSTRRAGFVGTVWHGCDQWLQSERCFESMRPRLRAGQWIRVAYEDLVADAEAEMRRVCDFLGVDDAADEMARVAAGGEAPWRGELGGRRLGLVQWRCGNLMAARGYEVETPPGKVRPLPGERAWLRLANRVGRFAGSARRYGLPLALARASRRFLPAAWRAEVLARSHEVERRLLRLGEESVRLPPGPVGRPDADARAVGRSA